MKTLFNKPALFIKYALTIMAFAVVLGAVFVIGFGFNTSAEFGGVYEITIDCFDETKITENIETAKDVLDEYGYNASEVIVEDRSICDTIVIRYASKSAVNASKVEEAITTKLDLNENLVSVSLLGLSSATTIALKMLLAFGVMALGIFVYLAIRMGWKKAVSVLVNLVSVALILVSICAITRIEISLVSLGVIFIISAMSAILLAMLFSKIDAISRYQENEKSFIDNYIDLIEANKMKAIIPSALVLLVFVCLIFTFSRALVFVGVVGLVALIVAVFYVLIFAPNFYLLLSTKRAKKIKK